MKQEVKKMSKNESKKSRKSKETKLVAAKEPWFTKTQKIVATIISVFALFGMLWSYGVKADSRYMKTVAAEELKKADARLAAENKYTSDRLDIKIMQDRRNELDSRIYKLENSRGSSSPEMLLNIREYKREKQELEKKIDIKQNQMMPPTQ